MYRYDPPQWDVKLSCSSKSDSTDVMCDLLVAKPKSILPHEVSVCRKTEHNARVTSAGPAEKEHPTSQMGAAMQTFWTYSALLEGLEPLMQYTSSSSKSQECQTQSYHSLHVRELAAQLTAEKHIHDQSYNSVTKTHATHIRPQIITRVFDLASGPGAAVADPVRRLINQHGFLRGSNLYVDLRSKIEVSSSVGHMAEKAHTIKYNLALGLTPYTLVQLNEDIMDYERYMFADSKLDVTDTMVRRMPVYLVWPGTLTSGLQFKADANYRRDVAHLLLNKMFVQLNRQRKAMTPVPVTVYPPMAVVWSQEISKHQKDSVRVRAESSWISDADLFTLVEDLLVSLRPIVGINSWNVSREQLPPLIRTSLAAAYQRLSAEGTGSELFNYTEHLATALARMNDFDNGGDSHGGDKTVPVSLDVYGCNRNDAQVYPLYNLKHTLVNPGRRDITGAEIDDGSVNLKYLPVKAELLHQQSESRFACASPEPITTDRLFDMCYSSLFGGGTQMDDASTIFIKKMLLSFYTKSKMPVHPTMYCPADSDKQVLRHVRPSVVASWSAVVQEWRYVFLLQWAREWINSVVWRHVIETCTTTGGVNDVRQGGLNRGFACDTILTDLQALLQMLAAHTGTKRADERRIHSLVAMLDIILYSSTLKTREDLERNVFCIYQEMQIGTTRASNSSPNLTCIDMLCTRNYLLDHVSPSYEEVRLYLYWFMQMQMDQERIKDALEAHSVRLDALQLELLNTLKSVYIERPFMVEVLAEFIGTSCTDLRGKIVIVESESRTLRELLMQLLSAPIIVDDLLAEETLMKLGRLEIIAKAPPAVLKCLRSVRQVLSQLSQPGTSNSNDRHTVLVSLVEQFDGTPARRSLWRDMICMELDDALEMRLARGESKNLAEVAAWHAAYSSTALHRNLRWIRKDARAYVSRVTLEAPRWSALMFMSQKYIYTPPQQHFVRMFVRREDGDPNPEALASIQSEMAFDGPRIWINPQWHRWQMTYLERQAQFGKFKRDTKELLDRQSSAVWSWDMIQRQTQLGFSIRFACPYDATVADVRWNILGQKAATSRVIIQRSNLYEEITTVESRMVVDMHYDSAVVLPVESSIIRVSSPNKVAQFVDCLVSVTVSFLYSDGIRRSTRVFKAQTQFRVKYDTLIHMNSPRQLMPSSFIHTKRGYDKPLTAEQRQEAEAIFRKSFRARKNAYAMGQTQEEILHEIWCARNPHKILLNSRPNQQWECNLVAWVPPHVDG